jgi:hypothetical protein
MVTRAGPSAFAALKRSGLHTKPAEDVQGLTKRKDEKA